MIVGNANNLDEVAIIAARERATGHDTFDILVEPRKQVALFLRLWDGVIGRVVGRAYYEEVIDKRNVDVPEARTVSYVRVRINSTSVVEAARRAAVRGDLARAAPMRVNQVAAPVSPSTVR